MPNTSPIDTQTQVRRLPLNTPNPGQAIAALCDQMGAAGYQLASCFTAANELVLIFQLTR
jgi:hypothetical protein